jgi:pyruvate dehydrogenase E1 component
MATTVPNCRAYDPCFAYELAIIIEYGIKRMVDEKVDEFFYITVMNENYAHPSLPAEKHDDIIRGLYHLKTLGDQSAPAIRLLGSGTILQQVIEAAELLTKHFNVCCHVFSVTSYSELARDAQSCERDKRLFATNSIPHVTHHLHGIDPVVCATDYVRAVPAQIAPYLHAPFYILGTDGFGRSANRSALREFFEVDAKHIALSAISALIESGALSEANRAEALDRFGLQTADHRQAPWTC